MFRVGGVAKELLVSDDQYWMNLEGVTDDLRDGEGVEHSNEGRGGG